MSILVIDTAASPSPRMVLIGDTLFKDVEMNRAGAPAMPDAPPPAFSPEAGRAAAMRRAGVGLEKMAGHPVEKEGADECAEASPSSSRP